mgnify:CR=1 FL=1
MGLGLQNIGFLDDNPIEREEVKKMLPEVRVLPWPQDITNVPLMLDEIYTAQRVEFSRGKFLGMEDGQVTKTVLTFMSQSAAGILSMMMRLCRQTE